MTSAPRRPQDPKTSRPQDLNYDPPVPPSPDTGVRSYLAAFLIATLAALVIDAVLQLALDAVRVSTYGGGAPWWITANLIERGRWVVFALLLRWLVPRLLAADPEQPAPFARASPADAWRHVATTVLAVPLLWIVATWAVSAVRFTLLGSWDTDGRVFLSAGYYRGLALDLAPWIMASAVVRALQRHLE